MNSLASIHSHGFHKTAVASSTAAVVASTPFVPTSITGCQLWLDAGDNSNFTFSSGSAISTWNDKSGKGNHMTQSTVAYQPTWVANNLNGRGAVNTGSLGWMQNTVIVLPTTYSIFAVAYTTVTTYARMISADDKLFFGSVYGNNSDFAGAGVWNDTAANSPSLLVTSWCIKDVTNTGAILTPYWNGTAQTSKVGTNVSVTGLYISTASTPAQSWNGCIAEVLIYSSVLSANDRQSVEGYLAWKWGLQSNLPVGHTYKAAAPLPVVVAVPVLSQIYPPATLTSNTTTISGQAYGNGIYIVSDSGEMVGYNLAYAPYILPVSDHNYCTDIHVYANNVYQGTTVTNSYKGVWNQLKLYTPMIFTSVTLQSRANQGIDGFNIFGSNNGTNWTLLGAGFAGQVAIFNFDFSNNTAYTYYRLCVGTGGTSDGYMCYNGVSWKT